MASAVAATTSVDVENKGTAAHHTLPSSWWKSEKIFDLEKRAIFNQSWMYCTHASRFKKPGDYYSFTVVGVNFFIIKTKGDGSLKAFHNVCRHRAYPVIRKEKGSSTILGCKYHGWSYNTEGKLNKAPQFDNVEGFKKEENSLFEIKSHVTPEGLVFVNFAAGEVPSFDDWFDGLSSELKEYDFDDYEYHMSYELDGQFNWKTLMDGYQECYHCPTAHPGLNAAFKMETYKVAPRTRYCRHYAQIVKEDIEIDDDEKDADEESSWFGFGKKKTAVEKKVEKKKNPGGDFDGLWVYLYPNHGVNCYSDCWYSIRVLPQSATHTILQYDIYTKKGLADEKKKEFVDFLQLVEIEDFNLCQLTQKNLNQGIYSTGVLHPTKENGVLFYQKLVAKMVKEHYAKEQEAGHPINPASLDAGRTAEAEELEGICNSLECQGNNPETAELQW